MQVRKVGGSSKGEGGGERRLFEKETARMREERDRLEEKDAVWSEAERTGLYGFESEVTWLEEQRQPCENVMVALQCPCGVLYCHHPKSREILPSRSVLRFSCLGRSTRCGGCVFLS